MLGDILVSLASILCWGKCIMLDDVLVSLASVLCWMMYLLVWQVYYVG